MEKRHIITIAGALGSGKSTAAKLVAGALGYPHHSGGDFMRQLAQERGISLAELGEIAKTEEWVDIEIDGAQKKFIASHDNFVIDSRLGWFFAPDSFRVFLDLDPDTAAKRIAENMKNNPLRQATESVEPEKVRESVIDRVEKERIRYKKYYGIEDHFAPQHFDLIIDTKVNGIAEVPKIILAAYKKWL